MLHAAAAFQVVTPRMFHQNAPHQLGRNRKEMRAILPLDTLIIHQAHVGLIYQGRRLEAMAGTLAFHEAACQAVEFAVNDGGQPFERVLVSAAPSMEQLADVAHSRVAGLCRLLHRLTFELYRSKLFILCMTERKTYENDDDFDCRGQFARRVCNGTNTKLYGDRPWPGRPGARPAVLCGSQWPYRTYGRNERPHECHALVQEIEIEHRQTRAWRGQQRGICRRRCGPSRGRG